jgi:putative FmdB family regulatory protein
VPTYSYKCADCGEAFDIQQAFTDDALTVCPNCGGRLRKVFGSVGVTFKGSGFYRTDSRAKPAGESSGSGSKGSGSKDSGSKDSGSKDKAGASSGSGSSSSSSSSSSGGGGSTSAAASGKSGSSGS